MNVIVLERYTVTRKEICYYKLKACFRRLTIYYYTFNRLIDIGAKSHF